jgi:hypothetical protein
MNVVGPVTLRLLFHGFVVVVGVMILAGAVNTAIVGSNGVLNRVSEDGVLADWFRRPHPRFGTSHRIINLVVALQLLTIFLSRGNVILLGEAYAFGVIWSFAMKGLGVLVLRFTKPGPREFQVPLNPKLGRLEFPLGLGFITLTLFATAVINLFTKEIATISGVSFTLLFYGLFVISEKINQRKVARGELDQFNLEPSEEITAEGVGSRPGNILVPVPDYFKLYHLASVLERVDIERQDVVVLHIRVLMRAGSGEHGLEPEQLFTVYEQELFTRALALSEKYGKSVKLAVIAASDVWDGILRAGQNLQSATIVLGSSTKMSAAEEARRAGLAWEGLPNPKPQLTVEVYSPRGREEVFYLGPHAPHLTPKEIDLLHRIWLECSQRLEPEEVHHHDIVHFALTEIEQKLQEGHDNEVLEHLKRHLEEMKARRVPHL